MSEEYWFKQTATTPLYSDILWSRPENRMGAGKMLIVGGNALSFAAANQAYTSAMDSGAGTVRALLPENLRKSIGALWQDALFAPANPSGGFGKDALIELLIQSHWADAVLLAGDLGRNSETAVLLESFVQKYQGLLTLTKDAVDYFYAQPELVTKRKHTTLVLSLSQLQKLGTALKFQTPFLLSMGLLLLVQALHGLTEIYPVTIITKELDQIVVAHAGKVSTTKLKDDKDLWRVETAAKATTFWMQNPNKPFEAMTSSLIP